jgi:hypothetical protein
MADTERMLSALEVAAQAHRFSLTTSLTHG